MKKFRINSLIALAFICLQGFSQTCPNLITNGGFEQYSALPKACCAGTVNFNCFAASLATGWAVSNSADYFHTAAGNIGCVNYTPSPSSGNAHVGVAAGNPNDAYYREYVISSGLSLTAGVSYKIEFYYKMKDNNSIPPKMGVHIGTNKSSVGSPYGKTPLTSTETSVSNGWIRSTSYFTPTSSTTHYIAIGSFNFDPMTKLSYYFVDDVSVIAAPVVTTNGSTTVCATSNFNLAFTQTGAASYTWNSNIPGYTSNVTTATYNINGPLNVTSAGNYTVTLNYTMPSGCTGTLTFPVTTNFAFTPKIVSQSGKYGFCPGGTVSLTATNTYAWTVSWYRDGKGPISNTNPLVTNVPGNYTVGIPSSGACSGLSQTVSIEAFPAPTVTVSPANTTICTGGTTTLTANGAATYSWSPLATSGNPVNVNPTTNTSYTVTGTDANGCSATATSTVYISPVKVPVPSFTTSNYVCSGDVLVDGTPSLNENAYYWQVQGNSVNWYKAYTGYAGLLNLSTQISGLTAGTYTITLGVKNQCNPNWITQQKVIQVNSSIISTSATPLFTESHNTCALNGFYSITTSSSYTGFWYTSTWYIEEYSGQTKMADYGPWQGNNCNFNGVLFKPYRTYIIKHRLLNSEGPCYYLESTRTVVVNCDDQGCLTCKENKHQTTNENELAGSMEIKNTTVFPNPTTGMITITMDNSTNENIQLVITDVLGKTIVDKPLEASDKNFVSLNLTGQPRGIYYLKLISNNENITKKIILE